MGRPKGSVNRPRGASLTLPAFNTYNPSLTVDARYTDWQRRNQRARLMKRKRLVLPRIKIKRKLKPRNKMVQAQRSGGYSQWETERKTSTLNKFTTTKLTRALKMLQAQREKIIYRWNGVKTFDDNGYYWLQNKVDGTNRLLPLYAFDLTSVINYGNNQQIQSQPLSQLFQDAFGDIYFTQRAALTTNGTTVSADLQVEQAPYITEPVTSSIAQTPFNKSYLRWASMKMNLWGCRNRSTKFTVQLVRFNDEDLVPTHLQGPNIKRTSVFQNIMKAKAFNPISTSGSGLYSKDVKVLKSETFIIQPTANYENDSDPHVKTINWFCRMDKLINYIQSANKLGNVADTVDQADFTQNLGHQNSAYANPKARIYLMIMSTNFVVDAADTNADTPSFDLSIRTCHEKLV